MSDQQIAVRPTPLGQPWPEFAIEVDDFTQAHTMGRLASQMLRGTNKQTWPES